MRERWAPLPASNGGISSDRAPLTFRCYVPAITAGETLLWHIQSTVAFGRHSNQREREMNTTEIRELDAAELDQVSGGNLEGWKTCQMLKNGTVGPGLVPDYVECGPYTNAMFVRDIIRYGNRD